MHSPFLRDRRPSKHYCPRSASLAARRIRRGVGAALIATSLSGCGQAPTSFGANPEAGRANAAEMMSAFVMRFSSVRRVGNLDHTHDQFVRHALLPSKLFADSTLWAQPISGPKRTLAVYGTPVDGRYHLVARPSAPHPQRTGDVRVVTSISRLAESEYLWEAKSELALGTLTSSDFFRGLKAALTELESRSERETRAEYRSTLPKSTATLSALFSLDSIRSIRLGDGSASHHIVIAMDAKRAGRTYPAFAKYLSKYAETSSYHFTLLDRYGAEWMDAKAGDKKLRLRLRTRGGELLPLQGPAREMPDSLQLRADFFANVLFFDVGMSEMAADVEIIRTAREGGISVRFNREPKWHFPLATHRLIKTPLRRPFAKEGALFRLTVRDSAGAPTVMSRQVRMAVQESGILRFLARLNRTAADDFSTAADIDSNRFVSDVFAALRDDVRGQLPLHRERTAQ